MPNFYVVFFSLFLFLCLFYIILFFIYHFCSLFLLSIFPLLFHYNTMSCYFQKTNLVFFCFPHLFHSTNIYQWMKGKLPLCPIQGHLATLDIWKYTKRMGKKVQTTERVNKAIGKRIGVLQLRMWTILSEPKISSWVSQYA